MAELDTAFSNSCFVDNLEDQGHRLIVDIRTSAQYSRTYVLNTINLSVQQLIVKRQLVDQPLLIVGEPQDRFGIGQLCTRLQRSGFQDVKILLGGIRALIEEGGKSNKPSSFNELISIDSRDILAELFQDQLVLIAASKAVAESLPEFGRLFDSVLDPEDRSGTLAQVLTRSRDTRFPLVIVGTETDYQEIRRLFNSILPPNVYLADGGPEAMRRYIRTNKQIQIAMQSVPGRYRCS